MFDIQSIVSALGVRTIEALCVVAIALLLCGKIAEWL